MTIASLPNPKTSLEAISEILLRDVNKNSTFKASMLWQHSPALIFVVRRPGCWLCREEALKLSNMRALITEMGINMYAVVHENIKGQIEEFANEYWHGKVYLDDNKGFYKALGGGHLRLFKAFNLFKPFVVGSLVRAGKKEEIKGNFVGEGRILGGLYIVNAGGGGIVYEHVEKIAGEHASVNEVLGACDIVSTKKDNVELTKMETDIIVKKATEKVEEKKKARKVVGICTEDGCEDGRLAILKLYNSLLNITSITSSSGNVKPNMSQLSRKLYIISILISIFCLWLASENIKAGDEENKEIPLPTTEYSALEGIELVQLNGGIERKVKAASLWEKKPLLVMVVRRPGCQLCREEVIRYAQQRDLITNKLGIPMIAVVHERIDDEVEQFNNGFWSGDVYYDEKKEFYNALGGGTLRWGGYLSSIFKPSVWSNINRNRQTNVNGNFKGEGRILGGLYVLRPGNSGIAYEYREKVWGDHAPFAHVMAVLQQLSPNGNDEDVREAVKNAVENERKVKLAKGQEAGSNYEGMACVKDGPCQ